MVVVVRLTGSLDNCHFDISTLEHCYEIFLGVYCMK
jgi:hypothetical protein